MSEQGRIGVGRWVAATLQELDDWAQARRLLEDVVAGWARLQGEGHPDTLNAKNNLAIALTQQGEHRAALELLEGIVSAEGLEPELSAGLRAAHLRPGVRRVGRTRRVHPLIETDRKVVLLVKNPERVLKVSALSAGK